MFTCNGYRVWFKHTRLANPNTALFACFPLAQAITICRIDKIDEDGSYTQVAEAVAACSRKDNFCKATGRKLALTRALADVRVRYRGGMLTRPLSKDERREFWQAYFDRMGGVQ